MGSTIWSTLGRGQALQGPVRWTLVLVAAVMTVAGCGSDSAPAPAAASSRVLPCTDDSEPLNFTAYSFGRKFENLPLTRQSRDCTHAPSFAPPEARTNSVLYTYGECEPIPGDNTEGRCSFPLSVQSWPRCERDPSDLDTTRGNPLKEKRTIRGVPVHLYEGGYRVEVYAGETTVIMYGDDRAQLLRAARALVKAPAKPKDPVTDGDTGKPLPSPPSEPIPCN